MLLRAKKFKEEVGATLVEYVSMASVATTVALCCVVGMRGELGHTYNDASYCMSATDEQCMAYLYDGGSRGTEDDDIEQTKDDSKNDRPVDVQHQQQTARY